MVRVMGMRAFSRGRDVAMSAGAQRVMPIGEGCVCGRRGCKRGSVIQQGSSVRSGEVRVRVRIEVRVSVRAKGRGGVFPHIHARKAGLSGMRFDEGGRDLCR